MSQPYLMQVEEFFVSEVQRGLVLRPADIEVIRDWERRGVPLPVVKAGLLTGIRNFLAAAEAHEPLPSSLRFFRRHVEEAMRAHQRAVARGLVTTREVSTPEAPDILTLAQAAIDLWMAAPDTPPAARTLLQDVRQALADQLSDEGAPSRLERLDQALAQRWIAVVAPDAIARVEADIEAQARQAHKRGFGACAIEDLRHYAMREAAARFGYHSLIDAILAGD